jgi:hypothetical protein
MAEQKKPSSTEDEYFAREDIEKLRKAAHDRAKALEQASRDELKALHHMHCPKCGMDLQTVQFRGIEIDRCFNCGVTVFDQGELEKLGVTDEGEHKVVRAIINWFK